jgi:hypothetical protein
MVDAFQSNDAFCIALSVIGDSAREMSGHRKQTAGADLR